MTMTPPPRHGATIKAQWDAFAQLVIPADAPRIQRIEMKRAFYAGAQGYFNLASSDLIYGTSDEEGVLLIEAWRQELLAFAESVEAGEA